nr:hypothetical protein GCM10025730_13320 [Promicromonospora thailandica]
MSQITDLTTLQRAIWENDQRPRGTAQAVAAESILDEARALGPEAEVKALLHLVHAYEFSADRHKMLVPFARALRLWDQDPSVFDSYGTHSLFWMFKWMTSGLVDLPQVPLAAIEDTLADMEKRYRVAGHTERAVRMSEFVVADHVGDHARARKAFDGWLTAARGDMADCHACEIAAQGGYYSRTGDDARAMEHWAPVLGGELTCAEEPHRTLARSLLPLVRLGRIDEARTNHLRGYPMVKGSESMQPSVARHIEFCALTGNEARGLELLADTPAYFEATGDPDSRLSFFTVTGLLMDRLVALGHGDLPVPGPADRSWTAAELAGRARSEALALAGRFDARNGTTAVSEEVQARLDARPLVDRLPLGLRMALAVARDAGPGEEAGPEAPAPAGAAPDGDTASDDTADGEAAGGSAESLGDPDDAMPADVRAALDRYEHAREAGDLHEMRAGMSEAIDRAGDAAAPSWRAGAHLQLSEVLAADEDVPGALHHAYEAVAWADLADPRFAVVARTRLGAHLMAGGRHDEAAPVLEQALSDLDPSPRCTARATSSRCAGGSGSARPGVTSPRRPPGTGSPRPRWRSAGRTRPTTRCSPHWRRRRSSGPGRAPRPSSRTHVRPSCGPGWATPRGWSARAAPGRGPSATATPPRPAGS